MKTIALKNIIDTWNMIEKLNVIAYKEIDATTVEVAECEYNRMLNATKNKEYIKNLHNDYSRDYSSSGWLHQPGLRHLHGTDEERKATRKG